MPQLSLHSPIGTLTLSEHEGAIVSLDFGWGRDQHETELLRQSRDQIYDYFDGGRRAFEVPLQLVGTPYQRRVWACLSSIPYGDTVSYSRIAELAGGSPRSAGQAIGCNHLPILIPCHRVVAARDLGGYTGGQGVDTKRFLLRLECSSA